MSEQINETKNKNKINRILLVLFSCVLGALFLVSIFIVIYNETIDVSDRNLDKFDFELNYSHVDDVEFREKVSYDSNKDFNNILISIPKNYFYTRIFDVYSLNEKFSQNYNITFKNIGILTSTMPNTLDVYMDASYNDMFDFYLTFNLEYLFNDNNSIDFYIKNIIIGDGLPKVFFDHFINIKENTLIYTIDSNNFKLTSDGILTVKDLNSIKANKKAVSCKFNYLNNIDNLFNFVAGDEEYVIEESKDKYLSMIFEILIGKNADEYEEISKLIMPQLVNNKNITSLIHGLIK